MLDAQAASFVESLAMPQMPSQSSMSAMNVWCGSAAVEFLDFPRSGVECIGPARGETGTLGLRFASLARALASAASLQALCVLKSSRDKTWPWLNNSDASC